MQTYGKEFYKAYNGQYAGDILSSEIIRQARPYIKGKVLDAGAGSGAMIKCIKKLNYVQYPLQQCPIEEVIGIDIAPARDDIIEASADDLPFESNRFDTVIISEVLEHLDTDTFTKTISEIHRVLKPKGAVVITVPYKDQLIQNMVHCPFCNRDFHRWGHVRTLDTATMLDTLKQRPFKIHKIEVIPLGFMATHKYIKYLISIIKDLPFVRYEQRTLFVIAEKLPEVA